MFSYNNNWIKNKQAANTSISKTLNIMENLDVFIFIDWHDIKTIDLVLNKIIDTILEKIWLNYWKTYNNLSISLDIINWYIKKVQEENNLNIIIWVLEENNFMFSKIWNSSLYMIKDEWLELVEVTNPEEILDNFSYISQWTLKTNDTIILSTNRLFDHITKSDILESNSNNSSSDLANNIVSIIKNETKENFEIWVIKFDKEKLKESNLWKILWKYIDKDKLNKYYELLHNKIINNDFIVNKASRLLSIKNNLLENKNNSKIIFTSWIIVFSILLYNIISWILWETTSSKKIVEYKSKLNEAEELISIAKTNITNSDLFYLNINKAEELIWEIRNQDYFLKEIEEKYDEISLIKKQFNWIESFDTNEENLIFSSKWLDKNVIKILENDKKIYLVTDNSIIWPIIPWNEPTEYVFDELGENDRFIDAIFVNSNIWIITLTNKVVEFTKNNTFSYADVVWQANWWEKSKIINSYNGNLYLLNEKSNQIYKHKPLSKWYTSWSSYLTDEDSKEIDSIVSIAIDWWIYILKNDLSLLKLFNYPKYRLESIVLNKLPNNYSNNSNSKIEIVARNDLNYIYFLLDNKIWVFSPSSKRYQDVKSLTYIWQIEWKWTTIKSFYVNNDGNIKVQNENWIYKLDFEITEDKIILR